jgi:hypothetical protein
MASTINALTSGGGVAITGDTSGQLQLQTNNGTTAITVDASQNVGIGVVPSNWASGYNALQLGASGRSSAIFTNGVNDLWMVSNAYFNGTNWIYNQTGTATGYEQNNAHVWTSAISGSAGGTVSFTERMRIDSSGNLLVGQTSNGNSPRVGFYNASTTVLNTVTGTTSTAIQILFSNPNGNVGSITTNGSSTAFNTSSDYRLKENIAPMQNALNVVQQLKPVTYNWKVDGSSSQGFIAHELQAVVPDCVSGEKDAVETVDDVDAQGKVIGTKEVPRYQGIDTSFLVATLTSAIQELKAIVDSQAERIATLEAK